MSWGQRCGLPLMTPEVHTEPGTEWTAGVSGVGSAYTQLPPPPRDPGWEPALSPPVCRTAETRPQSNPFLCMDLTYISLLLREFGFPGNKVLKVRTRLLAPCAPHSLRGQDAASCLPPKPSFTCVHGPLCPSLCLQLTRKINNVETSWALGAIFHYIDSLNGQKSKAS